MYKVEMYETPMGNKPIEKYLEKLIAQHKENELTEILLYIDKLKEYGFNINKNFTVMMPAIFLPIVFANQFEDKSITE